MSLRAFGLNCSLKRGTAPSSTQRLLDQILQALAAHGVQGDSARVADFDVRPGVRADEGDGDAWPQLRQRVLDADIVVLATPIWVGHPSSLAQRVLERMDAFLGEIGDDGVYPTFNRVAMVAVVGNEDGAHKVSADLYQGLTDFGFSVAAGSPPYWVGEAMGSTDYRDLKQTPKVLADTIKTAASNAAHLARLLKANPYPPPLA
ncbi:NADPH-dependent oxidoreductase [Xanthomonas sp. LMG 12462]|uniref:flavodoxin family protein n=1 Tax=Xanthomonas sp. LMG 12462 TaxID=1591134 RepID=UPI001264E636|nr:NAD(P)H-dependent oxidoreductase [Xanthomonas sp. LMG 12462]KAB7773647.1 NADPH-dependent oxidoreductase [Xanthomonas sp. LMG 12462]